MARPGGKIFHDGKEIGEVASGTFAPSLGFAIGMAYLPLNLALGTTLKIFQGTRELSALTVKMPFHISAKQKTATLT